MFNLFGRLYAFLILTMMFSPVVGSAACLIDKGDKKSYFVCCSWSDAQKKAIKNEGLEIKVGYGKNDDACSTHKNVIDHTLRSVLKNYPTICLKRLIKEGCPPSCAHDESLADGRRAAEWCESLGGKLSNTCTDKELHLTLTKDNDVVCDG